MWIKNEKKNHGQFDEIFAACTAISIAINSGIKKSRQIVEEFFFLMYYFMLFLPKKWFWWIWSGSWIGGKFKFKIWSFWLFVFKLEFFFQQFLERFEFWHNGCIIQTRFWLISEGRARKKNYLRSSKYKIASFDLFWIFLKISKITQNELASKFHIKYKFSYQILEKISSNRRYLQLQMQILIPYNFYLTRILHNRRKTRLLLKNLILTQNFN